MAIALRGTPTTAASTTITAPTGVAAGDILWAVGANSSGAGITTPAGWNQLHTGTSGFSTIWVGWLAWASGSTWTLTGAGSNDCSAYSGADTTTPFAANSGAAGGAGTTVSTPSITNPAGNWLLAAFCNANNYVFSTYSQSGVERGQVTSAGRATMADTNGAGASGSQAMTAAISFSGSDNRAWLGSLSPASGVNTGLFFAMM